MKEQTIQNRYSAARHRVWGLLRSFFLHNDASERCVFCSPDLSFTHYVPDQFGDVLQLNIISDCIRIYLTSRGYKTFPTKFSQSGEAHCYRSLTNTIGALIQYCIEAREHMQSRQQRSAVLPLGISSCRASTPPPQICRVPPVCAVCS